MVASLNTSRPVLDQDGREGTSRLRSITAATTLSQELHDGQTILINNATGFAITLPVANGTGTKFRFYVQTAVSSGSHTIVTASASDVYKGFAHLFGDDAAALGGFATTTGVTLTMDGTTRGGFAGDIIDMEDVATGVWSVRMFGHASGTEATPFS
jgi:hypothetical protein